MSKQGLQEQTLLILTALAAGPRHSYGIMTEVVRISGDRVKQRAEPLRADAATATRRLSALPGGAA